MCSASSHAGRNSHLYNAIRSYLHNVNRAQPIIGLNGITEMWTYNQPAVYFCDVCFLRIIKTDIRNHIMGSLHRYNYIKSHHAHGWRSYTDLTLLARPLMDLATIVEKKEGTGDVQVLCVDQITYKELTSWPVPAAFSKLNRIKNQQDLNRHQSVVQEDVQGLQEFENRDEKSTESTAPKQHVSTSPVRSKCLSIIEPLSQLSYPRRTPSPPRTSTIPLPFQYQDIVRHVVRPPGHWAPIPIQNESDGRGFSHPFGVGYSVHLAQSAYAYEAQLQTSSLTVSHMVPEITQNVTYRQESFGNESSTDTPEPVKFIEPIITQRRALEPPLMCDLTQLYDDDDDDESQEPINSEPHVEAQSHISVEEQIPLSLRNSATQTQNLSDQIQFFEDSPETYNGRKPIIGLQAIIKCQSVDGNPPPCCYLCQLCSLKLKKKKILNHLTGCEHQRNYIKVLHPQLFSKIKHQRCNINEMLEDVAVQLEREDGRGQIKVMRLSACLISEALHRDYQWCMKLLNCGASVEPFKTTGSNQDLKRPAESTPSPLHEDRALLSTHQMSKKMKKVHPTNVTCTKSVKNPVFKVSLSLQEGPVVIEREPLRVTATVAPEIEDQTHNTTYTDNNTMTSMEINRQFEVQTCVHGCPLTVYNPEEMWNTPSFPDGNMFIPTLAYTHTEVSDVDGHIFEDQVMSTSPYAYEEQFDQAIQVVKPSLRREDCGSLEELVSVTYEDWPKQDFNDNGWVLQRQIVGAGMSDLDECTRQMWDW